MTLEPLKRGKTEQHTVGVSAARIDASPLSGRQVISVTARRTNTVAIYVGFSAAVTTSDGFPLFPGDSKDFDFSEEANFYAISGSADQRADTIEGG